MLILAYDGDNAGKLVGRAILADDPKTLSEVSQRINLGHQIVQRWVQEHGGGIISGGGDEGTFQIPEDAIANIEELRSDYQFATNLTMTIGVGSTLSEAGRALIVGKFRGKNQVVMYGPDVDQEIAQSQANVEQGNASFEEQKLGQAYLKPEGEQMEKEDQQPEASANPGHEDCEYCKQLADEGVEDDDHCDWCHDMDLPEACPYCAENAHNADEEGHPEDCPLCAEMNEEHDPSAEGHPEDCPLCAEMNEENGDVEETDGPGVSNPTTTTSENFEGNGLPNPDMPKPDAISDSPDGLGTSFDEPTVENLRLESEQSGQAPDAEPANSISADAASAESAESILAQIDAIPSDEEVLPEQAPNPDDADMAVGTDMEGNISRPDGFEEDVPADMGLSEDDEAPDVSSVLQEGLDSHADDIQRERVMQMVGEALEGFKGCKDILERSKDQAPQLYQSSIAMLKAMIEMAKLLGLDESDVNEENPLEDQAPPEQEAASPAPPEEAVPSDPKLQGQ
jgi:hypothetical protein